MTTSLSTKPDAPITFGSRHEIQALAERIRVMIPSANLTAEQMQLPVAQREQVETSLRNALYSAAQICAFYRLVPGRDVHILPFGDNFVVDLGIQAYMKAADRYCDHKSITYHVHDRPMDAEELRERRGKDYDSEDVGATVYLWRSDKSQVYELFGTDAMTKGYGEWAKKGIFSKKHGWKPDTVPNGRTRYDVAVRRATKMALMREFSLDALLSIPADPRRDGPDDLEFAVRQNIRETALPVTPRKYSSDDLDDDMWA